MDLRKLENPVDDEPLPPPPSVAEAIPDWSICGPQSCGDHHHHPALVHPGLAQENAADSSPDFVCDVCDGRESTLQMHLLHCGHRFCRPCLNLAATVAHSTILENEEEIDLLLSLHDDFAEDAYLNRDKPKLAATLKEKALSWRREAWELSGFMCCGEMSGFWKYTSCMDPGIAKAAWKDFHYLRTPVEDRLFCGWPDCNAFVPQVCWYVREKSPRWYCVSCGGNSQISSSNRDGIERPCPAR